MSLTFEFTKNLTTDTDNNIEPYLVETPYVCEEPDATLYQYFTQSDSYQMADKNTTIDYGQYETVSWDNLMHSLSTRAVAKIGVKNFPQIGAIGFYKDKYSSITYILVPVHDEQTEYDPPIIAIDTTSGDIQVTITEPEDVTYTCYKIIMRSGYFANEYVMYELTETLPMPTVIGEYEIWAIGYNEDTGIISSDSNVVDLSVTSGSDDWSPSALTVPMSLSDLTDVSLVDLLNGQMIVYNSTTAKWENATV